MRIVSTLLDGQLLETPHPLDYDQRLIQKRIGDRVFVTCYNSYTEEIMSSRFTSYKEWKSDQVDYYNMCKDSDRHFGDGSIFNTELIGGE